MALLLLVMGLRYSTDQRFRPWPSLIPTSGNLTQTSQVGPMKSTRPATPPTNAYIYLTLPMRRVLTSPSRFHSKWTTLRLNPLPKTTQRRPSSSTLMLAKNGSKFFATRACWYRHMSNETKSSGCVHQGPYRSQVHPSPVHDHGATTLMTRAASEWAILEMAFAALSKPPPSPRRSLSPTRDRPH